MAECRAGAALGRRVCATSGCDREPGVDGDARGALSTVRARVPVAGPERPGRRRRGRSGRPPAGGRRRLSRGVARRDRWSPRGHGGRRASPRPAAGRRGARLRPPASPAHARPARPRRRPLRSARPGRHVGLVLEDAKGYEFPADVDADGTRLFNARVTNLAPISTSCARRRGRDVPRRPGRPRGGGARGVRRRRAGGARALARARALHHRAPLPRRRLTHRRRSPAPPRPCGIIRGRSRRAAARGASRPAPSDHSGGYIRDRSSPNRRPPDRHRRRAARGRP